VRYFIEWLGISLVVVSGVMLLVIAVGFLLEGAWIMAVVLGVFGMVALACAGCMATITLGG
jgi:hypothetical protein